MFINLLKKKEIITAEKYLKNTNNQLEIEAKIKFEQKIDNTEVNQ